VCGTETVTEHDDFGNLADEDDGGTPSMPVISNGSSARMIANERTMGRTFR
jgi:hypothetical protein